MSNPPAPPAATRKDPHDTKRIHHLSTRLGAATMCFRSPRPSLDAVMVCLDSKASLCAKKDFFFKEAEARRKPKRQICGAPFRFRDMRELRVSALEGLGPPSARSPRSPRSPISPRSPRGSSTSFLSSFDRDEMVVAAHDRMMYNRQRSQVRTASTATHATHCGHTDGTCPCSAAQAPHAAGGALQRQ